MADLTVGRVGADVTLRVQSVERRAALRGEVVDIGGVIIGTSVAEAQRIRDELESLAAMRHTVIPVTYTTDPTVDGYYQLLGVDVAASAQEAALFDGGYLPYRISLLKLGVEAEVMLQSVLTGTVRSNAHGVDSIEAEPFLGLPPGYYDLETSVTNPTILTRTSADGAVAVVRDVAYTDRPIWGLDPAGWYKAAATIKVGGYTRAGLACPNSPTDWELSNGLIRVTPNGTNLRWDVATYDGAAWDAAKTWQLELAGSEITGAWTSVTILRNDPEAAAIRLRRRTLTFDFLVRRGSRFVELTVTYNGTADMKVVRSTAEAATSVTPTGATSAVAIRATNDDGDGNRYVLGTSLAHTEDLTNGGITWTSVSTVDAFIGAEVGGSAAAAGDTAADLALHYLGYLAEQVVAVRR